MNRPATAPDIETARKVLGYASLRDQRIPRPEHPDASAIAAALAEDLAGISQEAALAAVATHYRESTERIMAGHIRAIVRRDHGGPVPRTIADSIAATEGGRADQIAAPHPEDLRPLPPGPTPPNGAAALEAALRAAAAQRVLPSGATTPTGFEPRRRRLGGVRSQTRSQPAPDPGGSAICFTCAKPTPAPDGWDPTDPASPPLYCAAHQAGPGDAR